MRTKAHVTVEPTIVPSPKTAFKQRGSLELAPLGQAPARAARLASESHGEFAARVCVMLFVITL